ncbi:MAG: methytransferase partner Trm112 [Candidatus Alkanophagales archaeon]
MKRSLMEILACPLCKGDLELEVEEEDGDEIIRGTLLCRNCDERYPIEDGIPDLRPPEYRREGWWG